MARVEPKPKRKTRTRKRVDRGVLVRGADGALYLVTEKDLPRKLREEKARAIRHVLKEGVGVVAVPELPGSVMKQIEGLAKCVKVRWPEIRL